MQFKGKEGAGKDDPWDAVVKGIGGAFKGFGESLKGCKKRNA